MSASVSTPLRRVGDRCPGAIRLHDAADGPLARIRVPGGLLRADATAALAALATSVGDGQVHLTVRGNVELRGIRDPAGLFDGLLAAGLLPSSAHERARNIVASPLAGLDGEGHCGRLGFADLVGRLDAAICAAPGLASLSGRFLFGLDDGRGDVLAQRPDLGVRLAGSRTARLLIDGAESETIIARSDVPGVLVAAALAFVDSGQVRDGGAWRVRDASSPGLIARLDAAARAAATTPVAAPTDSTGAPPTGAARPDHPVGLVARRPQSPDGAPGRAITVGAILPLATTDADTWRRLATHARRGDGLVRTTPWRGVLIGGLSDADAAAILRDLAEAGLVVDEADPVRRLTACTGLPGCARSLADVRARALASAGVGGRNYDDIPVDADLLAGRTVYWAGCERRCGHPGTPHVAHIATPDGFVTRENGMRTA